MPQKQSDDKHPVSIEIGPMGDPRCPVCRNSLDNGIPAGASHLRCCANCKTLFQVKN